MDSQILDRLQSIERKLDSILHRTNKQDILQEKEICNLEYQVLIGRSEQKKSTKYLKEWLNDANELIIADPYLYSFNRANFYPTEVEYTNALVDLIPSSLKKLDIFHLSRPNQKIIDKVTNFACEKDITLINYETNKIHDRVWIKNNRTAKLVGASFNGLGGKLAFIVDLLQADLESFLHELSTIKQNQASK